MLHAGAGRVSKEHLASIETPEATKTWKPIPHSTAVDLVLLEASRRGYTVYDEQYGLSANNQKMFGVLNIWHDSTDKEYVRSIGIRNSHDKSLAFGVSAGTRVLVCDNLSFSGNVVVKRKHNGNIDPIEAVAVAFNSLDDEFGRIDANIVRMKSQVINMDIAMALSVILAREGAINSCDIVPVINEYEKPSFPEFEPGNMWALHNAVTFMAKKYPLQRAFQCYDILDEVFGLITV